VNYSLLGGMGEKGWIGLKYSKRGWSCGQDAGGYKDLGLFHQITKWGTMKLRGEVSKKKQGNSVFPGGE